ncbi:MAG: hypothetical protein MI861_23625 [Pirellulales bacterium]|nr:hypothetical protein [Pirellulales bacterium]
MAAKLLLSGYYVLPIYAEFDIELPTLTVLLFHPMASVMSLAVALSVLIRGWFTSQQQRESLGKIAYILGFAAIALAIFGTIQPLWILLNAL